jgi:membrane protease YdiL (CAAX protease family)
MLFEELLCLTAGYHYNPGSVRSSRRAAIPAEEDTVREVILAQLVTHGASTAPATPSAPSGGGDWFWLFLLVASMPGIALCFAGVCRPRRVIGPDRGLAFGSLLQLAAVLFFGFFSYVLVISAFNTQVHSDQIAPVIHSEADDAFLTTIPPLIGFGLILAGDAMLGGEAGISALGVDASEVPRGIVFGFMGALVAVPLVMWTSVLTDIVYQHWHYVHPMEHELLPAMTKGPLWARTAIFFGAAVAAPLFEETVFRGHIQTLLRSAIIRVALLKEESPAAMPRDPRDPRDLRVSRVSPVRPWHSWLAIILASAAFAAVHPAWMRPPIFVLSICLGYAYERTGLLWTTITMHAVFNITETILYFQQLH